MVQFVFYFFAIIAIASSLMVIASRNPVRGALFLVLTFFAMAALWILLQAEFLALILVLVYVGAVMTLFLFVVMMLRVNIVRFREGFIRYLPFAVLILLGVTAMSIMVIGPDQFGLAHFSLPSLKAGNESNTAELGMVLYTEYAYPFEIAAVLLLAAIIAAIALTHRQPVARKVQNSSDQMDVRREDRVKLIQMKSEKKPKSPGAKI